MSTNMVDKEQRIKDINLAEKNLNATEDLRKEAITKEKMYKSQLATEDANLKELGTSLETVEEDLEKLQTEYDEALKFINENLPIDLLKKWNKV